MLDDVHWPTTTALIDEACGEIDVQLLRGGWLPHPRTIAKIKRIYKVQKGIMYVVPRHHTVPEMYLKGFLDPTRVAVRQHVLWVYEAGSKIRPRGVDAVAALKDFNFAPELEDRAEEAYTCQGRNKIRPDGGGKPDHLAAGSCV